MRAKAWCLGVLCAAGAHAFSVQHFRPVHDGSERWTVVGGDALRAGQVQLGSSFNWVKNPLEFGLSDGSDARTDALVDWYYTIDVGFAVGLSDRVALGVDLPVSVANEIEPVGAYASNAGRTVGDVRVFGKFVMVPNPRARWALSFAPFVTIPLNQEDDFFGESSVSGGGRLALDRHLGRHYLAVNVGGRARETETLQNLRINHELIAGAAYQLNLARAARWFLFVEAYGSTATRALATEEVTSPIEILGGFEKRWKDDRVRLAFGAGQGVNNGYGAPDVRGFAGVRVLSAKAEPTPSPTPTPEPTPEPPPPPPEPARLTVLLQDEAGHPVSALLQAMQDETLRRSNTPTSSWTVALPAGTWNLDARPEGYLPATRAITLAEAEERTETLIVRPVLKKIAVIGKILFDSARATLKPVSRPTLDNVVKVLRENPGIERVRIEAHTDGEGTEAYNRGLSQRRADTVRHYLIDHGIAAERLESQGFGESRPIADNKTAVGRAKNRRVEFTVLKAEGIEVQAER